MMESGKNNFQTILLFKQMYIFDFNAVKFREKGLNE